MIARRFLLGVVALAALITSEAASADPASHGAHVSAQPPRFGASSSAGIADAHDLFIRASLETPVAGACEMLSPDPAYVSEMLTRFGDNGAKTFERRVALVLGNGAYRNFGALKNPSNDAASMALMFRALGFTVYRSVDATTASLDDCLGRFKGDLAAKPADIALLFYAGHGVQLTSSADSEKRNYMLAVDASVDAAGNAKGFKQIDSLLADMRAHAMQSVFLYDACRNSPLGQTLVARADGAAVTRQTSLNGAAAIGEADVESGPGIFIAYATSPNRTADDAWGPAGSPHSPFTQALLQNLPTPGATIDEAFARAFNTVGELTAWKQTPWTSSSLTRELKMNGPLDAREVASASSNGATASDALARKGLRMAALTEALKAQPRAWTEGAAFAPAKAALARAFRTSDQTLQGHQWNLRSAEFAPDGTVITSGADNTVRFWDPRTGKQVDRIDLESDVDLNSFVKARLSPDGSTLAIAGEGNALRIVDVGSKALRRTLPAGDAPSDFAFSPDGTRLASVGFSSQAFIWTVATGDAVLIKSAPNPLFRSVVFSPDGQVAATVSSVGSPAVQFWSAATGDLVGSLATEGERVVSAAFMPDGARMVLGGADGVARIYSTASTGAPMAKLMGPAGDAMVAVSHDGARIASAVGNAVTLWSADGTALYTLEGHTDEIEEVAFNADGRSLITASDDKTARVWDLSSRAPLRTFAGHTGPVIRIDFDESGTRLASASWDKTARVWDVATGAEVRRLQHDANVDGVSFGPDSERLLTWGGAVRLWQGGAELFRVPGAPNVNWAAYSPDGKYIAMSSSDPAIRLFNGESGQPIGALVGHTGEVGSVQFSQKGDLLLSTSEDRRGGVWNVEERQSAMWLNTSEDSAAPMSGVAAISPDGARAITATPTSITVWTLSDGGRPLLTIQSPDFVLSASFSPDGRMIMTAGGGVRLWDSFSGEPLGRIDFGEPKAFNAAFSPRSAFVAAGETTSAVKLWGTGLYGPDLLSAAYELLTDELRAEVERGRIRYWELDPSLLQ